MKWSLLSRAHYGTGELGINALEIFIRVHLILFATQGLGLSTKWAGLILGASTIMDALLDPMIGRLSDLEKQKYNSRFRLLVLGFVLLALSLFGFLFSNQESLTIKYTIFSLSTLTFNCALSFLFVPYVALPIDWTEDRGLRGDLIASRLIGGNLGAFVGLGVPAYFLTQSQTQIESYDQTWATLFIFFVLCSILFSWLLIKRPLQKTQINQPQISLKNILRKPNKIFLNLVLIYLFLNIALTLNSSLAIPYYRTFLKLQENEVQTILLVFLLIFSLSIPVWNYLGNRFGRKESLLVGAGTLSVSQFLIYLLLPEEQFLTALFWASGVGGILVGCAVLLEALLSDFNEYLRLKKQENSLGVYLGVWKMTSKISRGLALALTGFALSWSGFDQVNIIESQDTGLKIAWIFGPGVGVFLLISTAVGFYSGLTERNIARIRGLLRSKTSL